MTLIFKVQIKVFNQIVNTTSQPDKEIYGISMEDVHKVYKVSKVIIILQI